MVKELLIRKVIQFILIEAIVLVIVLPGIGIEQTKLVIALVISILVIYVLSHLFIWFLNSLSAKQMTEELKVFQKLHKQQERKGNNEGHNS